MLVKVGDVYKTNNCGNLVITKYINANEVHVRFVATGYETKNSAGNIRKGVVKDRLIPSLNGVGVVGEEITWVDGKHTKVYCLWNNMIKRCYSDTISKLHPTYQDCKVSENFKYFTFFRNWCLSQKGFNQDGWHLDKDILIKGNKVYSEDTCVFVPQEINKLLIKSNSKRGEHLIGVCYHSRDKCFVAKLNVEGRKMHLGYYDTEHEAFLAYKQEKETYIKEVANKWKDQIDPRAYEALMNYQVEITD